MSFQWGWRLGKTSNFGEDKMTTETKQLMNYANVILGHPEDDGGARSCATFEQDGIDFDIRFMVQPNEHERFCLNRLFKGCGFTEMRLAKDGTAKIYRVNNH